MNDLLHLVVDAHGGLRRWEQIGRFRAAISITGAIGPLDGKPGLLSDVVLDGETRDQRLRITPFPWPGRHATWEPYRQTIQTDDGMLVAERRDPGSSFAGMTDRSPWDDLQVAYFAGEASWNRFVTPFILARPDFATEETEPWHEDGEVWRRLVVKPPDTVHWRHQAYCFDSRGLLRRLDSAVNPLLFGADRFVDYPSDYKEFDGILLPTRRRVYAGDPDGSPRRDAVTVAIDISDVTFG